MRMSWAPRGAFFVVLFAALMLATSAAAQACAHGDTREVYVSCGARGAYMWTDTCWWGSWIHGQSRIVWGSCW